MFSHVNVGARDLWRLAAFYDAVLAPLGLACAGEGTIRRSRLLAGEVRSRVGEAVSA